jgi:hypothetical protein
VSCEKCEREVRLSLNITSQDLMGKENESSTPKFMRLQVVKDAWARASCGRVKVKLTPCTRSYKGASEGPMD